ncbi:hypothetical protein L9F63_022612 [Diploptera punctata]|uniref:FAD dependent oxidoreductase domain-containing protein n=1 Tax=Diploptera punctata TaxID=6984 RepID=A0AAD8EAW5_DIPPU|nr:hypothetical protein L9F63_022612 [Diploptera punctata]
MAPRVAVVGAGVSGLSTAVLAQQKIPGLDVTIISDKFSPNTTGDISAGLWFPHCLQNTTSDNIYRWSSKTYERMLELWQSADADEAGICLVPKLELSENYEPEQEFWSKIPLAFQSIDTAQTCKLTGTHKYKSGILFMTFTLQQSRYLPYLTRKFLLNGGKIQQHKVEQLQDLCGQYDIVINCSGVHARHLVGDTAVAPIRGQVKAPGLFLCYGEQATDGSYVIPKIVILGGTHQQGNWNTNPDPQDTKNILDKCHQLIPALKTAEIISNRAGLRPGRTSVRIETEQLGVKKYEVIHNYGHGGSGVTLSWGCAHDVINILQNILSSSTSIKSKL